MAANPHVDLESGLAVEKIQRPSAAVVHERNQRGPTWWGKCRPIARLFISKIEHVNSDFRISPSGFPLGTFSDRDFCEFIRTAPPHIQNSVVCDMVWWESKRKPLHHQFLMLTIAHRQASGNDCVAAMYDICIERVGKAGSYFRAAAEQKIAIAPARLEDPYRKNSKVLFGLMDAYPRLRRDIEGRLPGRCVSASAFVDELDMKWRGPPATLWHIGRYVGAIVEVAPQYRLASTNCYFFARMLFHVVGLRHYSFHRIVSEDANALKTRNPVHDPSSISKLFWFLYREEKWKGHLANHNILQGGMIFTFALIAVLFVGVLKNWRSVMTGVFPVMGFMFVGALWCGTHYVNNFRRLRSQSDKLVTILDNDAELTNPRGKRGNYQLPSHLAASVDALRPIQCLGRAPRWRGPNGPRKPVSPWPNPEQCYTPSEQEDHGIQASSIIEVPDVVAVADTPTPVPVYCNSSIREVPITTQ